jgi:peptidoglycan/LPS O-acetylase OafA/YrhL
MDIKPLTSLRFIAAFYVFLFHIHIRIPLSANTYISNFLEVGAIGMSVFFILSGFILSLRYQEEILNPHFQQRYFVSRVARICPVYFTAALLSLPWFGVDFGVIDSIKPFLQASFLVLVSVFLIQAWFPQTLSFWNIGGSWSISVEAFFYSIFPFVYKACLRLSKKKLIILFFIGYLLSILPGLSFVIFDNKNLGIFYSMPIFRAPEFFLGIICFLICKFDRIRFVSTSLLFVVLIIFILYLSIIGMKLPIYVCHNWIVAPIILLFLVYIIQNDNSVVYKVLSNRVFEWLGKISYGFYSYQFLIIFPLKNNHKDIVEFIPTLANIWILVAISLVLLIMISAVSYHYIEEPMRRVIQRRFRFSRAGS